MYKKQLAVLGVILGAGILLATATGAKAYRGDPNIKGPNYSSERHEAMTKAFANNDYNAWKNLSQGRGRASQIINAGNFSKFAEAHRLTLEGKTQEANRIRTELGLGLHNGMGRFDRNANR